MRRYSCFEAIDALEAFQERKNENSLSVPSYETNRKLSTSSKSTSRKSSTGSNATERKSSTSSENMVMESSFSKPDDIFCISLTVSKDGQSDGDSITSANKHNIEDAIKATGQGGFHLLLLIVCGLGLMCAIVENVNIGFILSYIRCEMEITTIEEGFLNSVSLIGTVISSHMWGFLADTTGRRRVLLISMTGSFICAILSAFSFNVISLLVTRIFVAIFVSGTQIATYSYISEFHSNATKIRTLSFLTMFMPACFIYLALLALFILPMQWELYLFNGVNFSPWRAYLIFGSILNGLNLICLFLLPESPQFLLAINRKEDALKVLRKMYSINGNDPQTYPIKDLVDEPTGTALSEVYGIGGLFKLIWNQTWPLFQRQNVQSTLKLCYLMFILFAIGHATFLWYPDFLIQMLDYTEGYTLCSIVDKTRSHIYGNITSMTNASVIEEDDCYFDQSRTLSFKIVLLMGIVFVGLSALISFYIDKVDRKMLLSGWLFCCSVFSVLISLVPNFYIMAVCFVVFLSCGFCAGIINAISVPVFPTNIRAMATALIFIFGRLGAYGGSYFVDLLLNGRCEIIFYLYGVLILSCSFLCFFLKMSPVESTSNKNSAKIKCES